MIEYHATAKSITAILRGPFGPSPLDFAVKLAKEVSEGVTDDPFISPIEAVLESRGSRGETELVFVAKITSSDGVRIAKSAHASREVVERFAAKESVDLLIFCVASAVNQGLVACTAVPIAIYGNADGVDVKECFRVCYDELGIAVDLTSERPSC